MPNTRTLVQYLGQSHTLPHSDKIISTWTFMGRNWKDKFYIDLKKRWKEINKFIIKKKGVNSTECYNCGTLWSNPNYISKHIGVCCNCDSTRQPSMCNPINKKYVLLYIPKKYHHYIFPITSNVKSISNRTRSKLKNNNCIN